MLFLFLQHLLFITQWCPTLCNPIECSWTPMLLSHFSRVQLLATPWTAAYQAPRSMGFSRQKYWSGVPLPSPCTNVWKSGRKWTSKQTRAGRTGCGEGLDGRAEEEMATHSSILAWKIPWTEEPGRLWFMGSQRVRHDLGTTHVCTLLSPLFYERNAKN